MTPNSRSYLNHFTQPDTIVPDPSNSLDYDRYAYARNNPLRYNDPTGHLPIIPLMVIIGIGLFVSASCTSEPVISDTPNLDPRASEVQKYIDIQDYPGAIEQAIISYDIDTHDVNPQWEFKEPADGHTYIANGEIVVDIGTSAFESPAYLAATIYHESIHIEQYLDGRASEEYGDQGIHMNEVEAYDKELAAAKDFGLLQEKINELWGTREHHYNLLTEFNRNKIDNGFYSPE